MYPYIHLIIPSYGIMTLIGMIVAIFYLYFNCEKEGILFTELLRTILYGGIGLFIGSKLLFVITQIPWLIQNFSIENLLLLIVQSGYVFYGGLFGTILALHIMCKGQNEFKKKLFRLFVPAVPLFHVFGRIGCFLAGCCYGKYLENTFVIFNIEIDRIPIQLIEASVEFLIFVIICIVKEKTSRELLSVYLCLYAVARFFIEFFRGDEIRGLFMGLSISQYISISIILFYVAKNVISVDRDRRLSLN